MSSDDPKKSPDFLLKFLRISITTVLTMGTVVPGLVGCYIDLDRYLDRKVDQQKQQEQQAQLDRIVALENAGNYEECIREADKVPLEAKVFGTAQIHRRNCQTRLTATQLEQAKQQQQQYAMILEEAKQLLSQGEPENAIATVSRLPDTYPWGERRQQLINRAVEQARVKQRWISFCQRVLLNLVTCY